MSFSRDSYRSLLNGARDNMQKTQSNEDLIEPDRKRQRKGDVFGKISCVPCRKCHNSEVAMEMLIHYLIFLVDELNKRAKSKIIGKQNLENTSPNCMQGCIANVSPRILKLMKNTSRERERFNLERWGINIKMWSVAQGETCTKPWEVLQAVMSCRKGKVTSPKPLMEINLNKPRRWYKKMFLVLKRPIS